MKCVAGGSTGGAGTGSNAGGQISAEASAQIQTIITLIEQLQTAVTDKNFAQVVLIIQKLLANMKILGSLIPDKADIIHTIVEATAKLAIVAKGGNIDQANSIIVDIRNQLNKLIGGGAGSATGG